MSKEALKNIIDLVPDEDIETLYRVVIKFIPEDDRIVLVLMHCNTHATPMQQSATFLQRRYRH